MNMYSFIVTLYQLYWKLGEARLGTVCLVRLRPAFGWLASTVVLL